MFLPMPEDMLYHNDYQFILIGSGDPGLQGRFSYLASKYPERFAAYIGYASDKVSHLLEAGSDFFVMPSRYEPLRSESDVQHALRNSAGCAEHRRACGYGQELQCG